MNGNEKEPLHNTVVSNSGPLIALATVGKLDLLKDLFGQIHIPAAVYDEVVVHGEGKPGAKETNEAEWIKTLKVEEHLAVGLLQGENERWTLARVKRSSWLKELNADYVLIDEAVARRKTRLI